MVSNRQQQVIAFRVITGIRPGEAPKRLKIPVAAGLHIATAPKKTFATVVPSAVSFLRCAFSQACV